MEPVDDTVQPASLGQVLARERERLGLSRAEIAQRLHMSAFQVEALEGGDYSRLPKGTFLRGFVRNYAKQLSLPAEPLLARLQEAAPRPPAPGIVVPSQNIRFDPIGERLASPYMRAGVLAAVVIALALAAMYWWIFVRTTPPGALARKQAELGPPQQLAAAPVAAPETPAPTEAPRIEAPKTEPAKVEAVKAEPAKAEARPLVRGEHTLKFRFKGESWVEIRDGQGRLLVSRLHAAGSETEVAGRLPLTVVVGNAPDVQMLYDDRAFALEPHTKVAVARFTLE